MPQRNSSTFNSEIALRVVMEPLARPGEAARPWESETLTIEPKAVVREVRLASTRRRVRDAGTVALWMIGFLIVADIAIDIVFRMPSDPRTEPTSMQAYFDYGRSLEGKLRRMVADTDDASNPLALAGWIVRRAPVAA